MQLQQSMVDYMFQKPQKLVFMLYLIVSLLSLTFYYPLHHYRAVSAQKEDLELFHNKFLNIINDQDSQDDSEIVFQDFLKVITNQTLSGQWVNSIKQSKLLTAQNGTFKLQIIEKTQENQDYNLLLKIYDGVYIDEGENIITIGSSSIKTRQQFINNYLYYETTSPIIASQSHKNIFFENKIKPLYINRLKFRIGFNNQGIPQMELLLAAQYDINIIASNISTQTWVSSQLIFCLLLTFQFVLKSIGTYLLFDQNHKKKKAISPNLVKSSLCIDITMLITLSYLFCTNQNLKTYLVLPLTILVFIIFQMQCIFLEVVIKQSQQNDKNIGYYTQSFILALGSFILFYALNLSWVFFILATSIIITPQIIYNYQNGKPLYSLLSFYLYTCPQFINVFYLRLYQNNMFGLQPSYALCIFCILIMGLQIIMIIIQQKLGPKTIVPQFLNPQKLSQFKFFMIQTHDDTVCTICSSDLSGLPPNIQAQSGEVIVNKVVVTPCKHQFHYYCMLEWEQNKMQCPTCGRNLPPVNQQQLYYH